MTLEQIFLVFSSWGGGFENQFEVVCKTRQDANHWIELVAEEKCKQKKENGYFDDEEEEANCMKAESARYYISEQLVIHY